MLAVHNAATTVEGRGGFSQHPVDQIINELIQTGRPATPSEIDQIIERMATAPFNARLTSVPTRYRGLTYRGRTVGACEEPLFYHLVKRVVAEQQWAFGTTARQYLEDLRPAVRHHIQLGIYVRQGDSLAVTISRTFEVVPEDRLDTVPARRIIVVYSATRGVLATGYQFSSYPDLRIPEGASWLK